MFAVSCVLGSILIVVAVCMLFPAFVSLLHHDMEMVSIFLVSALLIAFVGGSLLIISSSRDRQVTRRDTFFLILVIWLVVPIFMALPFYESGVFRHVFDAYFEAVSGFTTTGTTLFSDLNAVPEALLFWRVLMDWIGGLTVLVSIFLVLSPMQIGGMPVWSSGVGNLGMRPMMSQVAVVSWLPVLYTTLTCLCIFALKVAGVPLLEAVSLSFSAISTSGFDPVSGGVLQGYGWAVQSILCFFILVGATNVAWIYLLITKPRSLAIRQEMHREVSYLGLLVIGFCAIVSLILYLSTDIGFLSSLFSGFGSAVSLISTSGLQIDPDHLMFLPLPLVLFVVIVGGCSFSTSGGVKIFRLSNLLSQAGWELQRLLYPHGRRNMQTGGWVYNLQTLKAMWLVSFLFIFAVPVGGLMIAATGIDFGEALSMTVTNLANAGHVYTILAHEFPSWPAYSDMGVMTKALLVFFMILGRMEIIGFLAAFAAFRHRF